MTLRLAALACLAAAPALAQTTGDPSLSPTADAFEQDVQRVVRLATAAALVHDRTGAFPQDAFGILGSPEGAQTGARGVALSALAVEAPPAEAAAAGAVGAFRFTPLPDPYVRDDEPTHVVVLRRPDGLYEVQYRIRRARDADQGGGALPYATPDGYRIGTGFGSVCVDPARARALADGGRFTPDPTVLSDRPLTIRVRPGGEPPVYFETVRAAPTR